MSKIFKSANQGQAPQWYGVNNKVVETLSTSDLQKIAGWDSQLSEDRLTSEMSNIEKCASEKQIYYCNAQWGKSTLSQLNEYAQACGTKIIDVNPQSAQIQGLQAIANSQPIILRTASTQTIPLGDAFGLDTKGVKQNIKDEDWQTVKGESKISTPDTVKLAGNQVKSIGGGEDYLLSPGLRVRPGQNSVTNPDAIGNLIKEDADTTVANMRQQNENRSRKRRAELQAAELKQVADAKSKGVGASPNHHASFIGDTVVMGKPLNPLVIANDQPDSKTVIQEANIARKASIQRTADTEKTWETVTAAPKMSVHDATLLTAIETQLAKANKPVKPAK